LPIAWTLGREPLASRVRLTAVVTLVDVLHFEEQRGLSPAVEAQVAYADVVVLTKTDLAEAAQVERVRRLVAEIAPKAPVIQGTPEEVVAWLAGALEDPELRIHRENNHVHDHDHERHHGVDSVWMEVEQKVDLEELEDGLAELGKEYVRIKGIVETPEGWWVVHRVGLRVSSEPLQRPEAQPRGRIVALGPGVERAPLAGCVERAVLLS
jgi:G3E family GTPase